MGVLKFGENSFKEFILNPDSNSAQQYTTNIGLFKSFDNLQFNEDINLLHEEVYNKNIILNGCIFKKINIEGSDFKGFIWFKNCIFENDFLILEGKFENFLFQNCEFKEGLIIHNIEVNIFTLESCISRNPIKIKGGILQQLNYYSSNEKTHLRIDGRFTSIQYLGITTLTGATISINESIVRILDIDGDYNSNSRLNFKNIKNFEISLDNVNNDGKIYFTDFEVEDILYLKFPSLIHILENTQDASTRLEIENLIKYNPNIKTFLQLYNHISTKQNLKNYLFAVFFREIIIPKPAVSKPNFVIKYSSMGIFELKGMELGEYDIIIMSTDLSSIKLINTFYPVTQKAWTYSDGLSIFMDLYSSANKQNNIADKIEYYKASQIYLYKKLSLESFSLQKIGSLLAIIISNLYSNHGSNWIRAIVITVIVIGIPFFGLFAISFEDITFDFSFNGIKFFATELLPYLPEFLNPLHRIDFMDTIANRGPWSGAIDLLSRILIGIGIFEMVRSFRKYVRT